MLSIYFNLFYVILLFRSILTDISTTIPSSDSNTSSQVLPIQNTYQASETSFPYSISNISEASVKLSSETTNSVKSEIQSTTTYQTVQTTIIYSTSGPVSNLSISSSFPSSPLIITWNPPQIPNGEIVQYFIWGQNNNTNQCVLKLTMNCTGCTNNITNFGLPDNNYTNVCKSISGSIFYSNTTTLSITINDSVIFPYSDYLINVRPLNGYGWGNLTNKPIKTNQYISGSVSNLSISSSFPSSPLIITWNPPQTPNGEIVQYFIWVQNNNTNQCVLTLTMNCTGCTNNIINFELPDNNYTNVCKSISGSIFYSNTTTLSITINDSVIFPYSDYLINVRPLNGYGWGNLTNKSIKTNQYLSGSVSNLSISSSFPSSPLIITWNPPQSPNGEIVQYFIWVQNNNNNQCVLKIFIDCINCLNNISNNNLPDSNINNCKEITKSTFNSSNTRTLSITINDSVILPYFDYMINVIPLNGYGWGISTNTSIKTNQYKSNGVSNLAVISVNRSNILDISWDIPLYPNGKIIQYFIWIEKNSIINECVLRIAINCTDCADNTSTRNFPDTRVNNCKKIIGQTFTSINTTFLITINDSSILSNSNYTIYMTPLNGFGWGDTTNKLFSTPSYISGPVENLIIQSSFPQYPLTITWETPRNPNGEIFMYFIWVQDVNYKCLLTKSVVCTNCNDKVLPISLPDNSTHGCNATNQETFNSSNTSFAIIITDLKIQPDTPYFINITPLNSYGWGQSVNRKKTTVQYTPDPVGNLQSVAIRTTINITWTAPKIHSLNFFYLIQISNQTFNRNGSFLSNLTSFSFYELEYCSEYKICIRVLDDYNLPSLMQCINQKTDLSTASINIVTTSLTKDTITLGWTYLSYSNCLYFAKLNINISSVETLFNYYIFTSLKPATLYAINITPYTYQTFRNISSIGYSSSVNMKTQDDVPSFVSNFTCLKLSYTSMSCDWMPPKIQNGKIVNYWISCTMEFLIMFNSTLHSTSVNITEGIVTDKLYTCQVNASTSVGYGPSSISSLKIKPAAIPEILRNEFISNVMSQSNVKVTDEYTQLSITLPYSHFTNNFGIIQKFTLIISHSKSDIMRNNSFDFISENSYQNQAYGACTNTNLCTYEIHLPDPKNSNRKKRVTNSQSSWLNTGYIIGNNKTSANISDYYCNGPLISGTTYVIGFRAYTSAGFVTVGFITMNTVANKISIIIGVTVGAFVITCIIIAIYFRIRYKRDKKPSEPVKLLPIDNKSPAVNEFQENFEFMKKDSNGRLIDDFLEIKDQSMQLERQRILEFTEGNDAKNRYSNIKPYKHNRVKLGGESDYINASRICVKHWNNELSNPCTCNNIYIATQGPIGENKDPKLCTIGDFWRMILENNVYVIVNLTRVEEHGKEKCSQYWPAEINKKMTYFSNDEPIDVTLQNFTDNINYVERVFQVSMNQKKVIVTQFHMLAWLDHSCPKTSDFLKFYENYQKVRRNFQSVVVHCSAGVGRTGTFILIDEELSRISKETDKIEIFNNLLKLRKYRCQMVQTDSQYCFIYTIVHEYLVQSGLVKLPKDRSNSYVFRQSYVNPIFVE